MVSVLCVLGSAAELVAGAGLALGFTRVTLPGAETAFIARGFVVSVCGRRMVDRADAGRLLRAAGEANTSSCLLRRRTTEPQLRRDMVRTQCNWM